MVIERLPYLNCEYEFSGRRYEVIFYSENVSQWKIELTDLITNEEWHTSLCDAFIEELTRKTGNFKRFEVFCSMIQSALSKNSSEQQSVESESLKALSRLQSENAALKEELRYTNECLSQMKAHQQMHSDGDSQPYSEKVKQLGLKAFVNNLETELFEERSKASRQMVEYTREIARLQADLEAATIDQRGMRRKIDQLSEELCFLKGGSLHRRSGDFTSAGYSVSNKLGRLSRVNRSDVLSLCQKSCSSHKPVSSAVNFRRNIPTRRAGSASPTVYRLVSHGSSLTNTACSNSMNLPSHVCRQRTNSLDRALSRDSRRFDPTAYVRERERQREENAIKRKLAQRQSLIGTTSNQRARSFSSLDNRYNLDAKNTTYTRFPQCITRKSYPRTITKYGGIHQSACNYNFNRSASCSPRPSLLRSSRSPVNGYYVSSSPQPVGVNTHRSDSSQNQNKRNLPTPLNDITTYKSSVSRSNVQSSRVPERHQIDSEVDSEYSLCSGRLSRRPHPTNRHGNQKKKIISDDADTELDEIDHRLNVLQGFFEKYLINS
ncbi:unnamed protein product [Heterobilharzia americana]|nr:unnamed protein product [Heterobilharzia americana]